MLKEIMEHIIDWEGLSWVEISSGIEVLHTSKFFRNQKRTHSNIVRHTLDEYRHGSYYRDFAKKYGKISRVSTNINLLEIGGLKKSKFPISSKDLISICTYLKVGEQRAWKSNEKLLNTCKALEIQIKLREIQADEAEHEKGLDNFLQKYPIKTFFIYYFYIFKFIVNDFFVLKFITKIKKSTDTFIIPFAFKILPDAALFLKNNDEDLLLLMKNKSSAI